ncbi:MAG: restriction endonuclease subunit S, partial [Campylobacteraceae bacterium]|nr:restriction endonuclease subunit S [Campylobacteraceae bacterium]
MSALLKFVQYKNLNIWSVKNYLTRLIYSDFNIVSLKECIQEENIKIKPFDFPEEDFKILGVSNKIGLFDNEIKKGKKINQPYKKVENGFLAYNPYRINVGSIGIKTESQKYDLISPAYVVFSCKYNLLPEFLFLIFKTEIFNNTIKESTRGSVRQNLSYDILETLQIPLPSVEEQKNILDIYNRNKDLSKNQTWEVSEKSDYIEDFLKSSLGIEEIKVKKTANLLMLTRFKTLDVWSVDNIVLKNTFDSNSFRLTTLEEQPSLVKEVFRGKSPKYKEQTGSKILNQKCIRFNAIEVKHAKSVDSNWLNKVDSTFLTRENDILINSTGDGT